MDIQKASLRELNEEIGRRKSSEVARLMGELTDAKGRVLDLREQLAALRGEEPPERPRRGRKTKAEIQSIMESIKTCLRGSKKPLGSSQISESIGIDGLGPILKKLVEAGDIKKRGERRNTVYESS